MEKDIILRVYENKCNQQKLITIPKKIKNIKVGDFVKVIKLSIR